MLEYSPPQYINPFTSSEQIPQLLKMMDILGECEEEEDMEIFTEYIRSTSF